MWRRTKLLFAVLTVAMLPAATAAACPFCSSVQQTFCEEIRASEVAVFAKMITEPDRPDVPDAIINVEPSKAKFEIIEVLKGAKILKSVKQFETIYFGDKPVGTEFLVMGIEPPVIQWSTPIALTKSTRTYIYDALKQPRDDPKRLLYFQEFLENSDEMLARDSYDEFAKMPYGEIKKIKDGLKHDWFVKWIKDPQTSPSHRRLYLTLLGVCGTKDDVPMLEEMIKSTDRKMRSGLDALIACYLTLKGAEGLPLIEEMFLKDSKAEYTDTYAAIMALRFHGQEGDVIAKQDLIAAFRHMLERPQLADLVIADLARWEDWGSMDRLVKLFKDSEGESSWVRVPVVNYLRACPEPRAAKYLAELEKIDPDSVKRANSYFPLGTAPVDPAAAKPSSEKAPAGSASEAKASGDNGKIKPTGVKPMASRTPTKNAGRPTAKGTAAPKVPPLKPARKAAQAPLEDGKLLALADEAAEAAAENNASTTTSSETPKDSKSDAKSGGANASETTVDPASSIDEDAIEADEHQPAAAALPPLGGPRPPPFMPSRNELLVIPLVSAVLLFSVYWIVLRSPRGSALG